MNNELLTIKFINVKNCFLHLSLQAFNNVLSPSVCGLKLTSSSGKEFFLSASQTPSSLITGNFAGISHLFANVLGLKENEEVIVTPIYNIGSLQSVSVTPKSDDDYEILHSTALAVESSLLNQLRIVWPNQAFPVWVSTNIFVVLIVDSISPNLKFGRLEEYSEVVVANLLPANGTNTHEMRDVIAPCDNSNVISSLKEKTIEKKLLKLRYVPLNYFNSRNKKYQYHPYTVIVAKNDLPEWVQSTLSCNRRTVWKLRKSGQELQSAIVNLALWEGDEICGIGAPNFKYVFISSVLKNYLGLTLGQKVCLELLNSDNATDIFGVLISSAIEEDEGSLLDEFQEVFSEAVSNGDVLLNTKAPFPLRKRNIILTLRPLHAEWGFVTPERLKWLSVNTNKFVSENLADALTSPDEEQADKNTIPSYVDAFDQGRVSFEMSLGLNCDKNGVRFCDNIIYVGKGGCGKSELVKSLLLTLRGPPFYVYTKSISCCSLKGKRIETFSKYLIDILQVCGACEPSILFLDDIDLLTSTTEENTEAAFHIKRLSHKIVELIESYQKKHYLSVVATAKSLDSIDPKVVSSKGKCLFTTIIKLPDFEKNDRREFVKHIISLEHSLEADDLDYDYISSHSEAYTATDLKKLCEKAVFEAWQRKTLITGRLVVTNEDFKYALENSKPSSLQQVNFFKGSKMSWKDVGGLRAVKEKLIEIVCWHTMYPEILRQCPVKSQNGVLLYGAPGTGKTLLAGALASESQMNFISIKGPELMSKYIGESEEGVRKLFEKAQAAKPCLLFFDEFDSLAPRRGQDQTGVTDRVVNQLLTALDGVDPMSGVWVIAATSRPDLIDPAVLRPGRIGISIRCELPDKMERLDILNVISSKIMLSQDVDIEELSQVTDGFTGADIKGVFTSAQIKAIEDFQYEKGFLDEEVLLDVSLPVIELSKKHIMKALNEIKPSLSRSDIKRYESIYNKFERREPINMKEQKVTHA